MRKSSLYAIVLGCALALAGGAMAADAGKGKRVFNKCKACHSLTAGKKKSVHISPEFLDARRARSRVTSIPRR